MGYPAVDSTFFADANARMASAMLRGVLSGAWDEPMAKRPLRALDRLWVKQRAPDGSVYHAMARGQGIAPGLLADQAIAALAYLDAYEVTGDARQLGRARALANWSRQHLEDRIGGGFRYAALDSSNVGRVLAGDKPGPANTDAATLFLRLYWLEERPEDLETAQRVLAWLREGRIVVDPGRALLAWRMGVTPIRLAVLGDSRSRAAHALAQAAFRAELPEKVLRFYSKGGGEARWGEVRFPTSPSAALYVCGERSCAPPITDPRRVDSQIRAFLASGAR